MRHPERHPPRLAQPLRPTLPHRRHPPWRSPLAPEPVLACCVPRAFPGLTKAYFRFSSFLCALCISAFSSLLLCFWLFDMGCQPLAVPVPSPAASVPIWNISPLCSFYCHDTLTFP